MKYPKPNLILASYSDAFVSAILYVLLTVTCVLAAALLDVFNISLSFLTKELFNEIATVLQNYFPIVLLIAISYQLSKRYKLAHLVTIFISLAVLITVETLMSEQTNAAISFKDTFLAALIIPLLVIHLLHVITPNARHYMRIGEEFNITTKYLLSSILTFIVAVTIVVCVKLLISQIMGDSHTYFAFSDNVKFYIGAFIGHIIWFFGLHGFHVVDAIFGSDYLDHDIFDGLTYHLFYNLFAVFGGSGAGLSLILAVFIAGQDKHSKTIAKLATPFAIFNINEILIFGLPIVFNRLLIIPFVLVPLINMTLAYMVLTFFPINVTDISVPWITPIFINAYLITDGNLLVLLFQLALLILGTFIYMPFVKKYTSSQSFTFQHETLNKQLDLKVSIENEQGLKAYKAKKSIIKANQNIEDIILRLDNENLMVYFQPKVDTKEMSCHEFEALLRIKDESGVVKGPYFLEDIELAGLAPVIDLWVCQTVKEHFVSWGKDNFYPKVSINLHIDTLSNDSVISEIIALLSNEQVDFELIERGLIDSEIALKNIDRLKESKFSISIDDFGTGFSSFETLCNLPANTIKIDKGLIDLIHTDKGFSSCKNIASLCHDMGLNCVAEGVETKDQLDLVHKIGIHYVQGFYFSKAISSQLIPTYKP